MNKMASTEVNNLFSVKGSVALVTGGTSGIGLMIAKVSSILKI
jgi:NADP-dependent 3-hydroxy acid dehydrogenase YdfG